ncbi:MAG: hypothetical protein J6O50_04180 [Ruminiclostridium sp.]|nr:hypothetical protein [Ruminiclostridium sp.]
MADILLGNVKGPQGNTGATGSQGAQGEAATITVGTVSTTAYGNTASVTNSGTEQDAVLDFVIPQGKPGEQTTRMGALTLDTITAQSADFPIPAVGETGATVFGKIIKFFNSTISALNSKLNISDVVNNLTSTSTTQPLSAAQGKALNDAKANMAAVTTGSLHDITKSGNYYLTGNVSGKPTTEGGIYLFSSLADDSVRAGIFYSPYKTDAGLNVVYSLNGTEFVNKIFGVFRYTVSGTTSTSGAIAIPAVLHGKALFGFAPTNFTGFVVQRDLSYFTVCKNDMTGPLVNTAVSFNVFYSHLSS